MDIIWLNPTENSGGWPSMKIAPPMVVDNMLNFSPGFKTPFMICRPLLLKKGSRTTKTNLELEIGKTGPPADMAAAVLPAAVAIHIPELFCSSDLFLQVSTYRVVAAG